MLGSGRKTTSMPVAWGPAPAGTCAAKLACTATVRGANAVLGMTPSFSHLRHSRSKGDTGGTCAAAIGAGAGGACAPGVGAIEPGVVGATPLPFVGAIGAALVGAAGAGGASIDTPVCFDQHSRTR